MEGAKSVSDSAPETSAPLSDANKGGGRKKIIIDTDPGIGENFPFGHSYASIAALRDLVAEVS
jgi:hypothetical protein